MSNPLIPSTLSPNMRGRDRVPGYVAGLTPTSPIDRVAYDSFTDTDGTDLASHTMETGSGWTANTGSITVVSNHVVCQSGTNDYTCDPGKNNIKIIAKFTCGGANNNFAPSIIIRGTDSTHRLVVYFSGDGNGNLYWQTGTSSFTSLGTFAWTADTSEHTATITAIGTTVTIQLDQGMIWTFNNVVHQAGGTLCGIRGFTFGGGKDSFDDFQVFADRVNNDFFFPYRYNTFTDNFSGADGTHLSTLGWTEDAGSWTLSSNQATQTLNNSPTNGYVLTRDIGFSDLGIETKITSPATGGFICGIVIRCQDLNNYLEVEFNTTNGPTRGFAIWYTNNTGVFTEVASTQFTPVNSTTYTLRIKAYGPIITAEVVESNLRIQGECGLFLNATKIGLFEARSAGVYINNNLYEDFKVYT